MGSWSLGKMLDNINGYGDIMRQFNFVEEKGGGKKPWSIRHVHKDGRILDTRMSDWTLYDKNEIETAIGIGPEDLKLYFLSLLTKEELIIQVIHTSSSTY